MSYPIKYLSLQKSELEYEVAVRGVTPGITVEELRKQIVQIADKLPSEDVLESHLESTDDLQGIKETLSKTSANINNLKSKFDKNLCARTESTINHLYHRLYRITSMKSDEQDTYNSLILYFKQQYKDLQTLKNNNISKTTEETTNSNSSSNINITCRSNLASEISKINFSGKSCVRSFILRIEEFIESRNLSHDKILSFAGEIFTGDALHWYRSVKDSVSSWTELKSSLNQDFGTNDFDYRFISEIRARTQGETENITIYLSIMHGMFSRLSNPVSEKEKLEILLHNIRPCYASTLAALPEIKNIEALKTACRNYETIHSRTLLFHEPKVTNDALAPEFVYNKPSTSNQNVYSKNYPTSAKPNNYYRQNYPNRNNYNNYSKLNYNNTNNNNFRKPTYYNNNSYAKPNSNNFSTKPNTNMNSNSSSNYVSVSAVSPETLTKKPFCPRCRVDTHSLRKCTEPRYPICFRCGKKDVRFSDCPVCNPTNKKN